MGMVVIVFTACGLTKSGGKTKIMRSRTKGMPESIAIFSVEVAGKVYNQTNELIYLGGNVNHNPDLSLEVNRRIRNAWCNFQKYFLELYNRPSASLELKPRMLTAEILYIMPYDCVMRRLRACHNDPLHQAPRSLLTRCIGWQNNHTDNSIFNLDTVMKTEVRASRPLNESEAYRVCGICGAHGGQKTAEVRDVRRTVGGVGCVGGQEKNGWGVSWTTSELSVLTPTSRRLQPRTRVNSGRRRNKERNVSWRNGLLQRDSGPDYGM